MTNGMEDNQIMDECCDTQTFEPLNIILPAIFEGQVADHPDHAALIFQHTSMSYSELNSKANQIAHYLRAISANKKMLVAVCMKPSFDLLIAILGILKAGSTYVPLDPDNPVSRIQFILDDTRASVILTQSSEINLFETNKTKLLCLDTQQEELNHYSTTNPPHINKPADLAYIIYTSGSTGKPKGVLITHANVMCFVHWYSKALSITHKDIFDFSSSVSFDFAVANTLFPMIKGATISICPGMVKKDPYLYLDYLRDNQVSIVKITPSHFRNMVLPRPLLPHPGLKLTTIISINFQVKFPLANLP
jgi:non-ribosomal peptide synthetase component F